MNIFAALIEWYLDNLNYWVLTILMVLENSIVPLPAELIVTPAAYNAAHGEMSLAMLIVCTTFGSTVGALINYYLSRCLGRFLVYRFMDSKMGRLLMLDSKKMEKAEHLFLRHGNISTFFGRLLPFGRQLISIPAGLARMPIVPFVFYTTIGSAIWNSLLVGVGYCLADVLPKEQLIHAVNKYSMDASVVFVVIIVIYVAVRMLRNKKDNT